MNVEEIQNAVDQGYTVHWSNPGYTVIKDSLGQYLIKCAFNDSCIGLTERDGVTLNGKEEEFFIEGQAEIYPVLSIDAWRDSEGGWAWNEWWNVGYLRLPNLHSASNRQILKAMREQGFLSEGSVGKAAVEDDQHSLVIVEKNTRQPIFAIEYGDRV